MRVLFLFFCEESFYEEGQEIGEGIKCTVPSDVFVSEFDAIMHIGIGFAFNQCICI